jgi:hypothetical protein
VETAAQWAANMSWKGMAPIVQCIETIYEKGIKVLPEALKPTGNVLKRCPNGISQLSLLDWDLIFPHVP